MLGREGLFLRTWPGSAAGGLLVAGLSVTLASGLVSAAPSPEPFTGLSGTWRGAAQIVLSSGSTESLKCNAYYSPKGAGSELGLAIRCASASNRIELRAQLSHEGGMVKGSWEERTYNAAGNVTGQSVNGRLQLEIAGGGFKGTMAVETRGSTQHVSIKTEGAALKSVSINLSRP
jgi:hypothetical protein